MTVAEETVEVEYTSASMVILGNTSRMRRWWWPLASVITTSIEVFSIHHHHLNRILIFISVHVLSIGAFTPQTTTRLFDVNQWTNSAIRLSSLSAFLTYILQHLTVKITSILISQWLCASAALFNQAFQEKQNMDGSGGSGGGDETDGDCQPVCQIG